MSVRVANTSALAKRVYDQASQPLASRTYLTREELAAQHGASRYDLDKIEGSFEKHNLFVVHRSGAERSIPLPGKL